MLLSRSNYTEWQNQRNKKVLRVVNLFSLQ